MRKLSIGTLTVLLLVLLFYPGGAMKNGLNFLLGFPSEYIEKICTEGRSNCVYKRTETSVGLNYVSTTTYHMNWRYAAFPKYVLPRIECSPDAYVTEIVNDSDISIVWESGDCEKRGERSVDMPIKLERGD